MGREEVRGRGTYTTETEFGSQADLGLNPRSTTFYLSDFRKVTSAGQTSAHMNNITVPSPVFGAQSPHLRNARVGPHDFEVSIEHALCAGWRDHVLPVVDSRDLDVLLSLSR